MNLKRDQEEPIYASQSDYDSLFKPVLSKLQFPVIQAALDIPRASIEHIVRVAREAHLGGARIIEAGTPAIKDHGVKQLLPRLKEAAPEALVLADLKTYDMGRLEAEIAIDAGADIVTVLGNAGKEVISEALSEAKRRDKAVFIDLMGCSLDEISSLSSEFSRDSEHLILSLHLGVTLQMKSRGIYSQSQLLEEFVKRAGRCVKAVAGGMKEGTIATPVSLGVDVIVVGSAIYNALDPKETTRRMLEEAISNYRHSSLE